MGLIREPLEVDFFVDPRPLTDKEKKMISDFIKADKEKRQIKDYQKKAHTTNPRYSQLGFPRYAIPDWCPIQIEATKDSYYSDRSFERNPCWKYYYQQTTYNFVFKYIENQSGRNSGRFLPDLFC